MESPNWASTTFTVNGRRYELSRAEVETRLLGVAPETIRKHVVRVNGIWFPVIQAFGVATGIPRSDFISHTARRHLATLGFAVSDATHSHRNETPSREHSAGRLRNPYGSEVDTEPPFGEWHTETNVQASVVTCLVADGWRILSVANTATKQRGIDVIASVDGDTVGVEVKGFPSRGYADPARAGEVKRTAPSTQAAHWYAQAVLAAMRLRGKEPTWRSVIALPDFRRYRDLHTDTAGSLAAAQIEVWWVDQTGQVQRP